MTLKYRYLRLWLASLCFLAGMHTSGFSFSIKENNKSLTEKRAQSIDRSIPEQAPTRMAVMISSSEDSARVETAQRQPFGVFLSTAIVPATFAYISDQPSIFTALCISSDILSALNSEIDPLILKALGNKQCRCWKTYNLLLWCATSSSIFHYLTGYEFFQNINMGIMTAHAVFKTALYVSDWYYSETREA